MGYEQQLFEFNPKVFEPEKRPLVSYTSPNCAGNLFVNLIPQATHVNMRDHKILTRGVKVINVLL